MDSPPTPPSSSKDSSDENTSNFNENHTLDAPDEILIQDRCFKTFCERNKDAYTHMDPDVNQTAISLFLLKTWKTMTPEQRNKYRTDYMSDNDDEDEAEGTFDLEVTSNESEKNLNKKSKSKIRRELSDQDDTTSVESETVSEKKQNSKNDPNYDFIMDLSKRRSYKLFKGMKSERVCQICEKPGTLIRCKGPCHSYFHLQCVNEEPTSEQSDSEEQNNHAYNEDFKEIKDKLKEQQKKANGAIDEDNFKCFDCVSGVAPACFICGGRDRERVRCSTLICGKHYHRSCLDSWPQCHWQGDRPTCPYHVCHTCVSDHPEDEYPRGVSEKLVRCIKCPTSYHSSSNCVPAGSTILTAMNIICPKHYTTPHPPVNTTWCFLCTKGGSLICCDSCPMSFHLECLGKATFVYSI